MYKSISKKSNPLFSQFISSINTTNTVYKANKYILYTKKRIPQSPSNKKFRIGQ